MSAEDEFVRDLIRSDPWVAAITPERIEKTLKGYPLTFAEGWSWMRLAVAIQDSVGVALGEPPQGNAEAIAELKRLAQAARKLQRGITRMGQTAELAAFWEAFRSAENERQADRFDQDQYRSLMIQPLEAISNLLLKTASQMATQQPQSTRWREKDNQERRVGFAVMLAPIFEEAFGTSAKANNWADSYGRTLPWPDFFERIYRELFPKVKRLNLPEVLQDAARQRPIIERLSQWLAEEDAIREKKLRE